MEQKEKDRIQRRDNKYAHKIGRFRFVRDLFFFISIPLFIGLIVSFFHDADLYKTFDTGGLLFCLLIAYAAHIRVQHIQTINYCRELESQAICEEPIRE